MGNKLVFGWVVGAVCAAMGCAGAGSGGTTAYSIEEFQYPLTSTDLATGQEVYAEYCEGCHPGAGGAGDGPEIAGHGLSPAQMRLQIRAGADDMPAFGPDKISRAQLDALLAYTETFGAVAR